MRMQAIIYTKYGPPDVQELKDVSKPTLKDDEVLIKVHAAGANAGDWHLLRGTPFPVRLMFGLRQPKHQILGSAVAGTVEAVGSGVTKLRPGDAVFGDISENGFGAYAEYVAAPETVFALKPANLSFEEAAAVPVSATTALNGLRDKGEIQPGKKVLINGASGGVGSFAVQIAKYFEAEVTAVCSSRNLELVRSLGADRAIDYTKEDFTQSGERYDLILGISGYHPITAYKRALNPGGIYVSIGGDGKQMFQSLFLGPWLSMIGDRKIRSLLSQPNQADLNFVKDLLESGKIKPVIDRRYSLSEVPEALGYLEAGHARGKVVITVNHDHSDR